MERVLYLTENCPKTKTVRFLLAACGQIGTLGEFSGCPKAIQSPQMWYIYSPPHVFSSTSLSINSPTNVQSPQCGVHIWTMFIEHKFPLFSNLQFSKWWRHRVEPKCLINVSDNFAAFCKQPETTFGSLHFLLCVFARHHFLLPFVLDDGHSR